jgi:hypothetical protein
MLLPEMLEVMIRSKVFEVLAPLSILAFFFDLLLSTKKEAESARASRHGTRVWKQGRNFEPKLAGMLLSKLIPSLGRHLC